MSDTCKSRRRLRIASCAKHMGASLVALSVMVASPTPALASVDGEMQSFMSDMGVQANATGPIAYQGQAAGYYSLGNVWSRFPQKNVQPFNLQLPRARAGCGGIDLFAGSFSFINTAELVAMLKATANNALGFAFKLAIDTISPEIGKVMDELAQKVQQMNQMNISSCESAQTLVNGIWKGEAASSIVCEMIANSQGAASDWAKARQNCNNGGQRESIKSANNDPAMEDQPSMKANYTWKALQGKYGAFDDEFKEFLMTMVGTVIYVPAETDGARPQIRYIGPADASLISAMLDGTSAVGYKRWKCDGGNDLSGRSTCLNPTQIDLVISNGAAIKPRVRALITSMANKARNPNLALTTPELQLLGMASIPVYKMITVSAAAEFGLSNQQINDLSEIVAVDLVGTMASRFIEITLNAKSDFQGADQESLSDWREQLQAAQRNLQGISAKTADRFDQTFQLIQRTQMLEKTLRTQMTPQMTASLRFSKSLSSQMQ